MSEYNGKPTMGWALRGNRVVQADKAAEYDKRAKHYRAREAAKMRAEMARQLIAAGLL